MQTIQQIPTLEFRGLGVCGRRRLQQRARTRPLHGAAGFWHVGTGGKAQIGDPIETSKHGHDCGVALH